MRRLKALIIKESYQIIRDPSSILIAFVLPCILIFLFGYGVSLDANKVNVGLVIENNTPEVQSFVNAFTNTKYFNVKTETSRKKLEKELVAGHIRGIIIIPANFSKLIESRYDIAPVQVIADGSEPNTASFVQNYTRGVWTNWITQRALNKGIKIEQPVNVESRFWFNPELTSRNFLLPGSLAIIMALIGILLTALVVAREWERGTMEAMMATPVSIIEILLGKLIPYFVLGMISMIMCVLAIVVLFGVPFRGSLLLLLVIASVFLFAALGQGLLISIVTKNQFLASEIALVSAFLPVFLLSGFIFEISSMPLPIQLITCIIPAKYFVSCLPSLFLAGNIWKIIIPNILFMLLFGLMLFVIATRKAVKRLD